MSLPDKLKGNPFCPVCFSILDGCTETNREGDQITGLVEDNSPQPKPGDITACCFCLTPLVFTGDLQLRQFRKDEEVPKVMESLLSVVQRTQEKSPDLFDRKKSKKIFDLN